MLERRELLTNSPPIVDDQSFGLPENSANGITVGTVVASDADFDALSYAITAGNTNGAFAIDALTGIITVANPAMLNFEATPTFSLSVDVSDGTETDSALITINLSNVNEAPSIGPASGSIWENLALGASLGIPNTGDPDAGDTRTISIVSGNTDGAFGIHPTTGAVIVANPAAIDFETHPSFTLGLRVTDAGGLTGDATWIVNLIDRNDIPTINTATFSLAENTPNGTVVGTIVANDQDAGDTKTFQLGNDNLSGVFAINSSGVLTVANSSILNYEARTSITVHVKVTDSAGAWADTTFTVNLTNVNDAPVVVAATTSRNENMSNGSAIGTLSSSDQDVGDTRTWAITSGNVGGTFAINATTGLITVANSATMNFEVTPTFVLTIQATDTGGLTGSATLTINLVNVNEAPIVSVGTFSLPENSANGAVVGNVPAVDPDAGAVVTYTITSASPAGAFAVNATTGQITVANSALLNFETTPAPFFFVKATDQFGLNTTNKMTVNLTNVQEAPTVTPQTYSIAENSAYYALVGYYSATDPEGGALTWSVLSGNDNGAFGLVILSAPAIRVANSAALDFETTPTFSLVLQAVDSTGLAGTGIYTINLTNVNEAPVVSAATFSLPENSANGTVVGTMPAVDPDAGTILTYSIVPGTLNGGFAINANTGAITVTNSALLNFEVSPSFSFLVTATDQFGLSATNTVTVNLTNVQEAPTVVPQTYSIAENSANLSSVGNYSATDPEGGTFTWSILSGNVGGAFALSTSVPSVILVADSAAFDFETTPTFNLVLQAVDSTGLVGTGLYTINLTNVNEAPTANAISFSGTEDTTINDSLTGSDVEGSELTFSVVSGPANGSLTLNPNGSFSYSPNANFNGSDSFTFKTNDGSLDSATATVSLSIAAVNDAPIANAASFSGTEDTTLNGTLTGSDIEGSALTFFVVTGPANGSLTLNAEGTFSYSPNANFNGSDSFTFKTNDGSLDSASATVSLSIAAVNDAPIANANSFSGTEDATLNGTLTGSDVEGSALTFSIVSGPANGSLTLNADGTFSYSPNANFNGSDSFTFETNDGSLDSASATVSLSIAAVNDVPIANATSFSGTEDTTLNGTLTGSDIEGSALTFSVVTAPANGSLTLNANGTFSFSPNANFNGSTSFTFKTNDGSLNSAAATVSLSIAAVNDAPTLSPATFSLPENSANGTSVGTASTSDPDVGDTKSFAILSGNTGGAFAINAATGAITVANTAVLDFETTPTFTLSVRVTDGGGLTSTANITVNLTDVVETKFFTVDPGTDAAYRYSASGTAQPSSALAGGNTNSMGVASDITGAKYWVIDSNKTVYVYNAATGVLLGSWSASGLTTPQGITTDGTHVWIIDSGSDKVFKYDNAASRLTGTQAANSSWSLNNSNKNSTDLVTNGTHIWTLESANTDKVFKYTTAGALVGSWTISAINATPTGLTINPANVSDIWIVDSGTDKVYQYTAAATRTSGSQAFAISFNLAAANTNAQGIADPPPPGTLQVTTAGDPLPASRRDETNSSSKPRTVEPAFAPTSERRNAPTSARSATSMTETPQSETLPAKKSSSLDAETVWSLFTEDSWLISLE
ncbi:MAG: beta strand repeat-containing protein [Planctomycetaceae bacterium]